MARQLLYTATLLLVLWAGVDGQFNEGSCETLEPIAGNIQQSTAPFFVAATTASYTAGGPPVSVFLASTTSITASSVVLQARTVGSNPITVGSFDIPSGDYQNLQCSARTGTIISSNTNPKTLNLQFTWNPPAVAVGDVEFRASLVQTNNNAWVRVSALNPLTGPPPPSPLLAIDACPVPSVAPNGVGTYGVPSCRRGTTVVGAATCSPPSGSPFNAGDTTVTCICSDGGDTETCSFTVTFTPTPTGCSPDPCVNGGNCIPVPVLPSGFFCNCLAGFSGTTCEIGGTGPGPLTVSPCPPDLNNFGNTFVWTPPNCIRDGNVVGTSTCSPAPATTFMGAVNAVTCTCNAGDEQATCPFNINAGPTGPACDGNPCGQGLECRETTSALAGYTCHSTTGAPCPPN